MWAETKYVLRDLQQSESLKLLLATVSNPQWSTSRINTFSLFLFNMAIEWSMSSALDGASLGISMEDMHVADLVVVDLPS